MDKMTRLAQKIYDTTPGINECKFFAIDHLINWFYIDILLEFPKKASKILAGIKHEEEVGARRAQNFMNKCEQIAELREQRKHGSIADKDLSKTDDLFT